MPIRPTTGRARRCAATAAVAVLLLGTAGCSDDKDGGGGPGTTPTPAVTASAGPSASRSATATASAGTTASPSASASASPSAGSSTAATATTVVIRDFTFTPAELTVAPGARITVTNEDGTAHTLTATGSGGFDTGTLSKGQSKTITAPSAPGSYPFFCTLHPTTMKGTLTVR